MTEQGWQAILEGEWEDIDEQWGPNSQKVWSAIECLGSLEWFEHVGEPLPDRDIDRVTSWNDAMVIFDRPKEYDEKGFPPDVVEDVWPVTKDATLGPWWRSAREAAEEHYSYSPYLPKSLDESSRDVL